MYKYSDLTKDKTIFTDTFLTKFITEAKNVLKILVLFVRLNISSVNYNSS